MRNVKLIGGCAHGRRFTIDESLKELTVHHIDGRNTFFLHNEILIRQTYNFVYFRGEKLTVGNTYYMLSEKLKPENSRTIYKIMQEKIYEEAYSKRNRVRI